MKNKASMHTKIILILTIGTVGLIIESITQNWEFWVPPLLVLGIAVMWIMHITQYGEEKHRENVMLVVAFASTIYHGVHATSFFDIAIANVLLTVTLSMLGSILVLHLTIIEYFLMLIIQLMLAWKGNTVEFSFLTVSRIILHTTVTLSVYFNCRWIVRD